MTGIDPDRLERRLRWAAEQLGLSPHASADEVRAAWLRRLPEEDFVPSSELRWALAALLRRQPERGWETRADEAASAAEEERLRGEVEAFAEQFWYMPADERRRRWQELTDRCAFTPTLRARLSLLESGLAVDSHAPSEDARVVELADHMRELFVLRPGPRARARRAILRRMKDDRKEWKAAVRRLRRACPTLASLGNDLLDKINTATPKRAPVNAGRQVPRWVLALIVLVATTALRGLMSAVDRPSSPPSPSLVSPSPDKLLFPPSRKDVPPEVWKPVFEKRPIQDKELREKLKKIFDEHRKGEKQTQNEEGRDKPAGTSP
jgi:hypothetical protein